MVGDGLYKIWKIERDVWLNGPHDCANHVLDDAMIVTSGRFSPMKFSDVITLAKRARAFDSVELTDRQYKSLGKTIVIAYTAIAKHVRFRRTYRAQCTTTYTLTPKGWKIASHHHSSQK